MEYYHIIIKQTAEIGKVRQLYNALDRVKAASVLEDDLITSYPHARFNIGAPWVGLYAEEARIMPVCTAYAEIIHRIETHTTEAE